MASPSVSSQLIASSRTMLPSNLGCSLMWSTTTATTSITKLMASHHHLYPVAIMERDIKASPPQPVDLFSSSTVTSTTALTAIASRYRQIIQLAVEEFGTTTNKTRSGFLPSLPFKATLIDQAKSDLVSACVTAHSVRPEAHELLITGACATLLLHDEKDTCLKERMQSIVEVLIQLLLSPTLPLPWHSMQRIYVVMHHLAHRYVDQPLCTVPHLRQLWLKTLSDDMHHAISMISTSSTIALGRAFVLLSALDLFGLNDVSILPRPDLYQLCLFSARLHHCNLEQPCVLGLFVHQQLEHLIAPFLPSFSKQDDGKQEVVFLLGSRSPGTVVEVITSSHKSYLSLRRWCRHHMQLEAVVTPTSRFGQWFHEHRATWLAMADSATESIPSEWMIPTDKELAQDEGLYRASFVRPMVANESGSLQVASWTSIFNHEKLFISFLRSLQSSLITSLIDSLEYFSPSASLINTKKHRLTDTPNEVKEEKKEKKATTSPPKDEEEEERDDLPPLVGPVAKKAKSSPPPERFINLLSEQDDATDSATEEQRQPLVPQNPKEKKKKKSPKRKSRSKKKAPSKKTEKKVTKAVPKKAPRKEMKVKAVIANTPQEALEADERATPMLHSWYKSQFGNPMVWGSLQPYQWALLDLRRSARFPSLTLKSFKTAPQVNQWRTNFGAKEKKQYDTIVEWIYGLPQDQLDLLPTRPPPQYSVSSRPKSHSVSRSSSSHRGKPPAPTKKRKVSRTPSPVADADHENKDNDADDEAEEGGEDHVESKRTELVSDQKDVSPKASSEFPAQPGPNIDASTVPKARHPDEDSSSSSCDDVESSSSSSDDDQPEDKEKEQKLSVPSRVAKLSKVEEEKLAQQMKARQHDIPRTELLQRPAHHYYPNLTTTPSSSRAAATWQRTSTPASQDDTFEE